MRAIRFCYPAVRILFFAQLCWAIWLMAVALLSWPALAAGADDPAAGKPAAKEAKEGETIPEPEDLVLQTTDGLELTLTYYPAAKEGSAKGKEAVPVVLLHMWKQSRNDYKGLARSLQQSGYAVIVPDLRGHGQSTRLKGVRRDETLDAAKLPPMQFKQMVARDMSAVKAFLWEQNNEGRLNIDKLCVVGAEMGASVALNFALLDVVEQEDNRVFGADREFKVGGFVKALVLISPRISFQGLPIRPAAAHRVIQRDIAMMVLVGNKDAKALDEAKRVHGMFERHHPEPSGDRTDKADKRTLWFIQADTSLQGTQLLDPKLNVQLSLQIGSQPPQMFDPRVTVPLAISDFIYRRLVKSEESKDWIWQKRKLPHG